MLTLNSTSRLAEKAQPKQRVCQFSSTYVVNPTDSVFACLVYVHTVRIHAHAESELFQSGLKLVPF